MSDDLFNWTSGEQAPKTKPKKEKKPKTNKHPCPYCSGKYVDIKGHIANQHPETLPGGKIKEKEPEIKANPEKEKLQQELVKMFRYAMNGRKQYKNLGVNDPAEFEALFISTLYKI